MQKKIKSKKSVSEPDTPTKPSRDLSREPTAAAAAATSVAATHFRKTSHTPPPSNPGQHQHRNHMFINSNSTAASTSSSSSSILSSFNNNNNKHSNNDYKFDKLNSKLEENKLKNIEFYQEKERLNKSLEHYKRINK